MHEQVYATVDNWKRLINRRETADNSWRLALDVR